MQVVITSFSELTASKANISIMESLQKTDFLYLFYGKGNDSMSFETHRILSAVKAKTEFIELEDPDMFDMCAAFLCGQYEQRATKITVITNNARLNTLPTKKVFIANATNTQQRKTASKPKSSSNNTEKPKPVEEKTVSPKKDLPRTEEKEARQETAGQPAEKKKTAKTSSKSDKNLESFKTFIAGFKTPEFDAEKYAMTILATVKEDIRYNKTDQVEKDIASSMDIYGLSGAASSAFKGKGKTIAKYIKSMVD